MYIEAVLHFENIDTIGLIKSAVFAKIKAKTFHVLPSNRNKLQKVTPRSLLPPYVHLMFTIKRKSTHKILVSFWCSECANPGLNQRPPDYESALRIISIDCFAKIFCPKNIWLIIFFLCCSWNLCRQVNNYILSFYKIFERFQVR